MASTARFDQDGNAYPLNRDILASARLNLQHFSWISSLGYLLHPSIPLGEGVHLAEIGCGTGVLSLSLARQLPTGGKIEAYDLSLAQCLPKDWWPSNVSFAELDIFSPIPPHLVGRYDVVYIRHFICVVQSGDPGSLLASLLRLLKPGGYLQWQEWDLQNHRLGVVDSANPEGKPAAEVAPKMKAYLEGVEGPGTLEEQTIWVKSFHNRLDGGGTELIAHDRHWSATEALMMKQETSYMGGQEWCAHERSRDPASKEAPRIQRLVDEAYEECWRLQRGTVADTQMVTWVARKQ